MHTYLKRYSMNLSRVTIILYIPCRFIVHVVLFDLSNTITEVAAAIFEIYSIRKKHEFELFFYVSF